MREPVRDRERLEHIVEAIANILDFADGKTKEELEANKLIYYGIVMRGCKNNDNERQQRIARHRHGSVNFQMFRRFR